MMPIGALFRGAAARRRSGVFFRRLSGANLAAAEDHVLLRGEALEAHRAARMQLVGRNADLRAQAVLEAVGEARRSVHQYGARIDLAQETPGARFVFGDDRVGMLRSVPADVLDRRAQ